VLRKIGLVLLSLGTLGLAVIIGYRFYEAGADALRSDRQLIVAFISCLVLLGRLFLIRVRGGFNQENAINAVSEFFTGAFAEEGPMRRALADALVLMGKKEYKKAIKAFDALLRKCVSNEDEATVHFFTALCYEDMSDNLKAIECYERAVALNPGQDTALSNLGSFYRKAGRFQDAVTCFQKALAVNPKNEYALNNIAISYFSLGDTEKAITYADRALKIAPAMHQAMNTLALSYALLGNKDMAEKYYRQGVANGSKNAEAIRARLNQMG
jgi:Flp pilus assembly protein TadD, contains TPR repeats